MASQAEKDRQRARQAKRFDPLLALPENRECFDCTARAPTWASTNLGVFICMRCAGIHRGLGTHISKVKSVNMDLWDDHMMDFIEHMGNKRAKLFYEANLPARWVKAQATADNKEVERVIRAKYESKLYYANEAQQMAMLAKEEQDHAHRAAAATVTSTPAHAGHPPPQPSGSLTNQQVVSAIPASALGRHHHQPPNHDPHAHAHHATSSHGITHAGAVVHHPAVAPTQPPHLSHTTTHHHQASGHVAPPAAPTAANTTMDQLFGSSSFSTVASGGVHPHHHPPLDHHRRDGSRGGSFSHAPNHHQPHGASVHPPYSHHHPAASSSLIFEEFALSKPTLPVPNPTTGAAGSGHAPPAAQFDFFSAATSTNAASSATRPMAPPASAATGLDFFTSAPLPTTSKPAASHHDWMAFPAATHSTHATASPPPAAAVSSMASPAASTNDRSLEALMRELGVTGGGRS